MCSMWKVMNVKQICRQVQSLFRHREGMLLLDVEVCLLFLAFLGTIFYQQYLSVIKTSASLEADLRLYQANRYTQQLLMRELSINARAAFINTRSGEPQLLVRHALGGIRHTFYVRKQTLYRKQDSGLTTGINPYSAAGIRIRELTWKKLSSRALLLSWCLQDEQSGRTRVFEQVHVFGNGVVLD